MRAIKNNARDSRAGCARLSGWLCDDQAVTSIEYALLASLIAVVILGAVTLTGENLARTFTYVSECVRDLECPPT